MSSNFAYATHPVLGEIEVEYVIESHGYPSNNWDDPGAGPEYYVDGIKSASNEITWYLPSKGDWYHDVERLIEDSVVAVANEPPDESWWDD